MSDERDTKFGNRTESIEKIPRLDPRREPEMRIGSKHGCKQFTSFVEALNTSTVNLLLAEKPFAREALQELVVKEAGLRWIARVATLSHGDVRARLWADVDEALDDSGI